MLTWLGMQHLIKLPQLEVLCVRMRVGKAICRGCRDLQHFKKLKEVDIEIASANIVTRLRKYNPDFKVLRLQYWRKRNADGTSTYLHISNDAELDVIRSKCPGIDIQRSYYLILRRWGPCTFLQEL